MAVNIIFAGDLVPHDRTKTLFLEKKTEFIFGGVIPVIKDADYSVVNYEAPVVIGKGDPIEKSGPHLASSFQTMEVVKEIGFNMITLANNHFRDQGQMGVKSTLDSAKKLGLDYVGGGSDCVEAGKTKMVVIKDKSFAFMNFCEQEYSIATPSSGGSNPYDIINITKAIQEAKNTADYVILIIHGGIEHYQLPSPRMKKEYRFFVDVGADAVINHHQHCFSGYELYNGKPICYGLGNFCFDRAAYRTNGMWDKGYLVRLTFTEEQISMNIIPYSQCGEEPNVRVLQEGVFDDKISELNSVILDDDRLMAAYQKLVSSKQKKLLSQMNAFGCTIFDKLYKKGLLGELHKMNRVYIIKDLLYCESHLDVLKNSINELLKGNEKTNI